MKNRDKAWLERLWADHAGRVRAYLQRRVAHSDVDDLLSEIFIVAWRNRDGKPRSNLPWLYGIARRIVSTHYRTLERRNQLQDRAMANLVPDGTTTPLDWIVLTQALESLRPDDREILLLVAWEGLTPSEIAIVVGASPPAVRMRLTRARRRFENKLKADPHIEGARR